MENMSERLKEFGEQIKKLQQYLQNLRVEGDAGGGLVRVVANGFKQIVSIEICDELFSYGDSQFIGQLVKAACNDALKRAQECTLKRMMKECFSYADLAQIQELTQIQGATQILELARLFRIF